MPQIFHPSMNTISRVTIFGAVFFIAAAVVVAGILVRSPYLTDSGVVRPQPIPFSHAHHVGDVGIDCRYCHHTVESEAFAGMPSTRICLDCHSNLWADSEMLAPVRESRRSDAPIRWNRVHDLPDFAYFHHGIHVQKGIACETCHGDVSKMPLMWRENTLHMEWCLACHRHPEPHIRPPEAVFAFGQAQAEPSEEPSQTDRSPPASTEDGNESPLPVIRNKTDCSHCHR